MFFGTLPLVRFGPMDKFLRSRVLDGGGSQFPNACCRAVGHCGAVGRRQPCRALGYSLLRSTPRHPLTVRFGWSVVA
jgi:hypothetical protein